MTRQVVEERLQPKGPAGRPAAYRSIKLLGIAATGPRLEEGRQVPHAAILYRWKKNEIRLFEMHDHKKLRDEPVREGASYVWVEPAISEERLRLVVNRARLVYQRNQTDGVPYGFGYRTSCFDQQGGARLGSGEIGFTCSTIVAAILEAEKLPILDPTSWPAPDKTDIDARRAYLKHLQTKDPEHAKVLEIDIESPRIAPEEVIAAAALHPPTVTFDSVQEGASVVRMRIGT